MDNRRLMMALRDEQDPACPQEGRACEAAGNKTLILNAVGRVNVALQVGKKWEITAEVLALLGGVFTVVAGFVTVYTLETAPLWILGWPTFALAIVSAVCKLIGRDQEKEVLQVLSNLVKDVQGPNTLLMTSLARLQSDEEDRLKGNFEFLISASLEVAASTFSVLACLLSSYCQGEVSENGADRTTVWLIGAATLAYGIRLMVYAYLRIPRSILVRKAETKLVEIANTL